MYKCAWHSGKSLTEPSVPQGLQFKSYPFFPSVILDERGQDTKYLHDSWSRLGDLCDFVLVVAGFWRESS